MKQKARLSETPQVSHGRSERIRTSDPLLPKQVRYQAALRSDREGAGSPWDNGMQGGILQIRHRKPRQPRGRSRRCNRLQRGAVTASLPKRARVAGRRREAPSRSRSRM